MDVPLVEPDLVKTARIALSKHQALLINDKNGLVITADPSCIAELCESELVDREHSGEPDDGVVLDVQTANLIVHVYDALSAQNKAKFAGHISKIGCTAYINKLWRLVK